MRANTHGCTDASQSQRPFLFISNVVSFFFLMTYFFLYSWFTVFRQFSPVQPSDPVPHTYILFLTLSSITNVVSDTNCAHWVVGFMNLGI